MSRFLARCFVYLLATATVYAQEASPEATAAQAEYDRIKQLVDEGAVPRKALEDAQARLEEAQDQSVLRSTLYGRLELEEMTEDQSKSMIGAAERLLDRQKKKADSTQKLIEEGVLPLTALTPYLEEMERARRVHEQAVGRARLFEELAQIVQAEHDYHIETEDSPLEPPRYVDRFEGDGIFSPDQYRTVQFAFEREFGKDLPVSARGDTRLHRTLGFDHRGRVDVALYPDSEEGQWLRSLLESMRVPYYAFRRAVRGSSTGAHIHIGPPSPRVRRSD